jgi:uncharacterized protein
MIPYDEDLPYELSTLCCGSKWIYSDKGGVITILPEINQWVRAGDVIAIVRDPFGSFIKEYKSEYTGIVIGKKTNPINQTGDRILILGVTKQ